MSHFTIPKSPSEVCRVANKRAAPRRLLTTADAAKELHLSRWRVLQLAEQGDLPFEFTRSGQYIYHLTDVRRVRDHRSDRQAQPRAVQLQAVRVRMLKATPAPRQVALRLVRSGSERSFNSCGTKRARSGAECGTSDRRDSVNTKVAHR